MRPLEPLFSPSVTVNTGSYQVTVTGNIDCSAFNVGTMIYIGSHAPTTAAEGTAPDQNGISTVTLARPWAGPNVSGEQMIANMTYQDLLAAIYKLQDLRAAVNPLKEQLANANSSTSIAGQSAARVASATSFTRELIENFKTPQDVLDAIDAADSIAQIVSDVDAALQGVSNGFEELAAENSERLVGGAPARRLSQTVIQVSHLKALPTVGLRHGQQYSVAGFYAGSNLGGGLFVYDANRPKADHNGVKIIAPEALVAWGGSDVNIASFFDWAGGGHGCFVSREPQGSFFESGADLSNSSSVISNSIRKNLATSLFKGAGRTNLNMDGPIQYRSERTIKGLHYSFGGTILIPNGNYPVFTPDGSASAYTRVTISDLMMRCEQHSSAVALPINELYLCEFERLWFKDSFIGTEITNSDSLTFSDCKWMETQRNKSVKIGNGARSIRFFTCNFETNSPLKDIGGVVEINGPQGYLPDAQFFGGQWERSGLTVDAGRVFVTGGKFADCNILLLKRSKESVINTSFYGQTYVRDFGFNNTLENVSCTNMNTAKHEWPTMQGMDIQANNSVAVGLPNTEWLALVTLTNKTTTNLTNAGFDSTLGAGYSVSGIYLHRVLNSIGMAANQCHTTMVYGFNGATKNTFTANGGAHIQSVKGGINLLSNGRFANGNNGWSTQGCNLAASPDFAVVTPTSNNWGLWRDISTICKPGKRYIAVAKFSGEASLVLGQSWDGSSGSRYLLDPGMIIDDDGFKTAIIVFTYYRSLGRNISLGRPGNLGPVTVKYIALVGVDDEFESSGQAAYYQSSSSQQIGNAGTLNSGGSFVSGAIPVAGAEFNDFVVASFNKNLMGVTISGYVREPGVVVATFFNGTAAPVQLGTGTISVRVYKRNV